MGGSGQGVCLFLLSFAVLLLFCVFLLASMFSFVCVLLLLLCVCVFFVCFVLGDGGDVYA